MVHFDNEFCYPKHDCVKAVLNLYSGISCIECMQLEINNVLKTNNIYTETRSHEVFTDVLKLKSFLESAKSNHPTMVSRKLIIPNPEFQEDENIQNRNIQQYFYYEIHLWISDMEHKHICKANNYQTVPEV